MRLDEGREFYNKDVQKLVELYSTENDEESCVTERLNRTSKEKIVELFSANNAGNVLMYLTYLYISTIMQFINR